MVSVLSPSLSNGTICSKCFLQSSLSGVGVALARKSSCPLVSCLGVSVLEDQPWAFDQKETLFLFLCLSPPHPPNSLSAKQDLTHSSYERTLIHSGVLGTPGFCQVLQSRAVWDEETQSFESARDGPRTSLSLLSASFPSF